MNLKSLVRKIPVIGSKLAPKPPRPKFTTSADYWDQRYRLGGNSGPGSYDRLARFKADFLNRFVRENDIRTIIEFGSGDGAQLALADYPSYIGVDVSRTAVDACRARFAGDATKAFHHVSELPSGASADLSMSLDVLFHLVEDPTFESYMHDLFEAGERFVIVFSSNKDEPGGAPHVRHRQFTDWVEANRPNFALVHHEPNAYPFDPVDPNNTSFADFFVFERRG